MKNNEKNNFYRNLILLLILILITLFVYESIIPESRIIPPADLISSQPGPKKAIQIKNFDLNSVTIWNVGLEELQISELNVYVNNQLQSCSWSGSFPIQSGGVLTCFFQENCSKGQIIKINTPGNFDQVQC